MTYKACERLLMKKNSQKSWPEIVFSSSNSAESQAIRRAVMAGELRKIAPRLYTSDFKSTPAALIRRHCFHILAKFFPGAVISHRSALEGGVSTTGMIVLTYKYDKRIQLPGLMVCLVAGNGKELGDTPFMEGLFMASRGGR